MTQPLDYGALGRTAKGPQRCDGGLPWGSPAERSRDTSNGELHKLTPQSLGHVALQCKHRGPAAGEPRMRARPKRARGLLVGSACADELLSLSALILLAHGLAPARLQTMHAVPQAAISSNAPARSSHKPHPFQQHRRLREGSTRPVGLLSRPARGWRKIPRAPLPLHAQHACGATSRHVVEWI